MSQRVREVGREGDRAETGVRGHCLLVQGKCAKHRFFNFEYRVKGFDPFTLISPSTEKKNGIIK